MSFGGILVAFQCNPGGFDRVSGSRGSYEVSGPF